MIDWIGKEISHYRVLRQLGQGGMGVVYLAEDLNIGRRVVLKLLRADLASDPQMSERFHREARACAAVVHPNITTVYEVSNHEGNWYICMEFVEGVTVRARLREGKRFSIAEAIRVAAGAAEALGAAHLNGIVHRDMKPENIMLTPAGQVKVLDFGLAAFTSSLLQPLDLGEMETGVDRLTMQGVAIGTLHYMSPEQTRGRTVTPASDVFSLGAVLYELLTGRPPFRGNNSLEVMHAIAYDQPAPLAPQLGEVPLELEQIVRRALRKEPDQRPASGSILRAELVRILSLVDKDAPSPAPGEPPPFGAASRHRVESTPTTVTGPAVDAGLIGREREVRILLERLDAAVAGEGSFTLIRGEAGVGKTRLVGELARLGESRGARYLQGRCLFREGALPYHPFVEAAERLIAWLGLDDSASLESYVRERMPSLAGRLPILKSFLHVSGHESTSMIADKEHLLDAISALFLSFARERPMILVLDDLHWADEATLDLLLYLARNCRQSQGLLIGTYRPEEVTRTGTHQHPLARVLDKMSAGDAYLEIRLARLGRADTEQVISSTLQGARLSPEFVDLMYAETAGNPFYVLETLKLLVEDGTLRKQQGVWKLAQSMERVTIPGRVHDVVTRRLSRVSDNDREMLEIAAAEGMVFHSDTIASCLGMPRIRVLGALQRAEKEHHIIHAEAERYTFDHPLIREILYEAIIPELRREYHRLMGDHLSANRKGRPGEEAAIAWQYLEAGREEAALPFLLDAGDRARRLYANAEALNALNRAEKILLKGRDEEERRGRVGVETSQRTVRLYKERGRLHQRLGNHDRAMSDYLAMQRGAIEAGLLDRQAHALGLMADLYYAMGEYDQAMDRSRQAKELALQAGDKRSLSNALRAMGAIHFYHGEFDEALRAHTESVDIQREIDDVAGYAENLNKIGNIHLTRGDSEKAEAVYRAALGLGRQAGHRLAEAESLNNLGVLYYYEGDAAGALERLEECLAIKRELGDRRSLARSMSNLGMVYEMRGDLAAAVATHQESLALIREINDQGSTVTGLCNLSSVLTRMGRYSEAIAASEESLAVSETIGDRWVVPYSLNCLGRVRLVLNQPAEAEKLFERALDLANRQGKRLDICTSLLNLGTARTALGRDQEGHSLLERAAALAGELKARDLTSEAAWFTGLARAGRGAPEAAALRELASRAGELKSREGEIRRLHLEGIAAVAEGDTTNAVGLLRRAADLASEVGLKEHEWRLRADLAAALGEAADADRELLRGASIVRNLAEQTGSAELSAIYLSEPRRRALLEGAARIGPVHDDSNAKMTDS